MDKPAGKKVIGTKWVPRVNTNSKGSMEKYKARVVAKKFSWIEPSYLKKCSCLACDDCPIGMVMDMCVKYPLM